MKKLVTSNKNLFLIFVVFCNYPITANANCVSTRLSGQQICEPLDKTNLFYELFYPENACEKRNCCWQNSACYKPIIPEINLQHLPQWSEWSDWTKIENCKIKRTRKCDGIFTGQLAEYFCKTGNFEQISFDEKCKKVDCLPKTCGINSFNLNRIKKIVGGSRAEAKSFPWMVALLKFEENDREFFRVAVGWGFGVLGPRSGAPEKPGTPTKI